jgi:hypothetical protein
MLPAADLAAGHDLSLKAEEESEEAALSAPLPGGGWRLWRQVLLRGAGFPAHEVLRLASPAFSAAADRLLDEEERAAARRAQMLLEVNELLDRLRAEGRWEDKDQRRPLLKAVQALTTGKLPAAPPHPSTAASFGSLREAEALRLARREEMAAVLDGESSRLSQEIAAIAGSPRFREAVIWQNPHAATTALDSLRRGDATRRGSQQRQHEQLVASYLQRYCVKNDTIGFFGPIAFAWLGDDGSPVASKPGPGLLQNRTVHFESWPVDALARRLAAQPDMRPWLAPRLKSSYHLEGDRLHRSFGPPMPLSPFQAGLLAACDGVRSAREIAGRLALSTAGATAEAVYRQLDEWARKNVLAWTLEVPFELHPLRTLERSLRRIEDSALREPALAAVAALEAARHRVSAAAGDPDALHAAMDDLESTFTALTGAAAERLHGVTYAARGLVYEDCRRDLGVRLGPGLLERLGPPLTLVLDSARWLAGEINAAVGERLNALHAKLCATSGATAIDSLPFFSQAFATLLRPSGDDGCFAPVAADFRARWARLLGDPAGREQRRLHFSTTELRERFDTELGNPRPGWALSRYLSPDVMIRAADVEAIDRGDFTPVLGEVHYGNTLLWSCFVSQHPDPEQLRRATGLPHDQGPVLFPHTHKHNSTQRMSLGVDPVHAYHFAFGDDAAAAEGARLVPAGALVIAREGARLVARSRDGRLVVDAVDLLGFHLAIKASELLGGLLPRAAHLPRISIDDLVVSRERWAVDPAALADSLGGGTADRLAVLRRWARGLGLPRFCFYKSSAERKPCFLDLDSPVLLDLFTKQVRAAAKPGAGSLTITEMLPDLDQTWLVDRTGNHYTSELRFASFRS